jgi:hypothetical protein
MNPGSLELLVSKALFARIAVSEHSYYDKDYYRLMLINQRNWAP